MAAAAKRWGSGPVGLTVMLTAMVLLNYVDRGALGIAAPKLKEELGLDATGFGLAVSAFSWVYAPAVFIAGWLISRVCVYRLVAVGLALWAAATTLTSLTTGLTMLVAMRLLLGAGEGVAFPACSAIIARHVSGERRGLANAAVSMSLSFGPAVGTLAGGVILAAYGWREIFLVFGLLTLVWLVPWLIVSKPHWARPDGPTDSIPMRAVMRQPAAWNMGIAHFLNTYGFYFLLAWLPLYLVQNRHFSILEMTSVLTSFYLISGAASFAAGWVSDRLSARYDESKVRRAMMSLSLVVVAVSIFGVGNAANPAELMVWLVIVALGTAPGGAQCYAIAQMYAGKRASGPFVGIMNGIGNSSGIVGPILTGVLVDRFGYTPAFAVASAIAAAGALWWWFALPAVRPLFDD